MAQHVGAERAGGFDHIVYGWVFFALVMGALLAGAWRYFDRSPEDPLIDAATLEASPLLAGLARFTLDGWRAVIAIVVLAAVAGWMDRLAQLP